MTHRTPTHLAHPARLLAAFCLAAGASLGAHAVVTSGVTANCGVPSSESSGSFLVSADCRVQYSNAPEPYVWHNVATAGADQPSGDGPTLVSTARAEADYDNLLTGGSGGSRETMGYSVTRSQEWLTVHITDADPTQVYTLRTQLYFGGSYALSPQVDPTDPYGIFRDGYLRLEGQWSATGFGVLTDGSDSGFAMSYDANGLSGVPGYDQPYGGLHEEVVTFERTVSDGLVFQGGAGNVVRAVMKNNSQGTFGDNLGLGSGSLRIDAVAGVVGFSIFDAQGQAVAFEVTAGGNPFVFYTPPPVPEPQTWALMLAGLAGVVRLARRRVSR